jgi:hypothetical protein
LSPSSFPSSQPSSSPTSRPTLEQTTETPSNLPSVFVVPTPSPSSLSNDSSSSSTPSFPITSKPTGAPKQTAAPKSARPSHSPTTLSPTRLPTVKSTVVPSFRPTRTPSVYQTTNTPATATTTTTSKPSPLRRPTLRPISSSAPTSPNHFNDSISSITKSFQTIYCNDSVSFHGSNIISIGTQFIIESKGTIRVTCGIGRCVYTIASMVSSNDGSSSVLVINDFDPNKDIVDLGHFPFLRTLADLSHSSNPVVLYLSSEQQIWMKSVKEFEFLTSDNFIFASSRNKVSSSSPGYDGENFQQIILMGLLAVFFLFIGSGLWSLQDPDDKEKEGEYDDNEQDEEEQNWNDADQNLDQSPDKLKTGKGVLLDSNQLTEGFVQSVDANPNSRQNNIEHSHSFGSSSASSSRRSSEMSSRIQEEEDKDVEAESKEDDEESATYGTGSSQDHPETKNNSDNDSESQREEQQEDSEEDDQFVEPLTEYNREDSNLSKSSSESENSNSESSSSSNSNNSSEYEADTGEDENDEEEHHSFQFV